MNRRGSGEFDPYANRRRAESRQFAERDEAVNEELLNRVMRHTLRLEQALKDQGVQVQGLTDNVSDMSGNLEKISKLDLDEMAKTARNLSFMKKVVGGALVLLLPYLVTASVTLIKGSDRLDRLEAQVKSYNERSEASQLDIEHIRSDIRVLVTELKHTQEEKDLIQRMSEELELLEKKRQRRRR